MQRIAVLGLGLIGTSIALGLRRWATTQKPPAAMTIVGYDADLNRQRQAKAMKAIDQEARDLPNAVRETQLLIVATPISQIAELLTDCAPHLADGATVTDVASVKACVLEWAAQRLPAGVHFVGGHPMAGGTDSIDGAKADLFHKARWCVVPSVSASQQAVELVVGLATALGARAYFVDAHEHDGLVAGISHLPFSVAAALIHSLADDPAWREMQGFAAGGFRDTTRVAEGSPIMHRDIAINNAAALTRHIDRFLEELTTLRGLVAGGDPVALQTYFETSQDQRVRWRLDREREVDAGPAATDIGQVPSLGDAMQQMFLGGFGRQRRPTDRR